MSEVLVKEPAEPLLSRAAEIRAKEESHFLGSNVDDLIRECRAGMGNELIPRQLRSLALERVKGLEDFDLFEHRGFSGTLRELLDSLQGTSAYEKTDRVVPKVSENTRPSLELAEMRALMEKLLQTLGISFEDPSSLDAYFNAYAEHFLEVEASLANLREEIDFTFLEERIPQRSFSETPPDIAIISGFIQELLRGRGFPTYGKDLLTDMLREQCAEIWNQGTQICLVPTTIQALLTLFSTFMGKKTGGTVLTSPTVPRIADHRNALLTTALVHLNTLDPKNTPENLLEQLAARGTLAPDSPSDGIKGVIIEASEIGTKYSAVDIRKIAEACHRRLDDPLMEPIPFIIHFGSNLFSIAARLGQDLASFVRSLGAVDAFMIRDPDGGQMLVFPDTPFNRDLAVRGENVKEKPTEEEIWAAFRKRFLKARKMSGAARAKGWKYALRFLTWFAQNLKCPVEANRRETPEAPTENMPSFDDPRNPDEVSGTSLILCQDEMRQLLSGLLHDLGIKIDPDDIDRFIEASYRLENFMHDIRTVARFEGPSAAVNSDNAPPDHPDIVRTQYFIAGLLREHLPAPRTHTMDPVVTLLEAEFTRMFEQAGMPGEVVTCLVPTGTAGGGVALSVLLAIGSGKEKVLCSASAHQMLEQSGAIPKMSHMSLHSIGTTQEGKISVEALLSAINSKPANSESSGGDIGAVVISVAGETGALYSLPEIQRISKICRENKIALVIDGARIFVAAAALGVVPAEIMQYADVTVLSGTKTGAEAELVVFPFTVFNQEVGMTRLRRSLKVKQGLLGAWLNPPNERAQALGFLALLRGELAAKIAALSNKTADRLRKRIRHLPKGTGVELIDIGSKDSSKTNAIFIAMTLERCKEVEACFHLFNFGEVIDHIGLEELHEGKEIRRIMVNAELDDEAIQLLMEVLGERDKRASAPKPKLVAKSLAGLGALLEKPK